MESVAFTGYMWDRFCRLMDIIQGEGDGPERHFTSRFSWKSSLASAIREDRVWYAPPEVNHYGDFLKAYDADLRFVTRLRGDYKIHIWRVVEEAARPARFAVVFDHRTTRDDFIMLTKLERLA
jgi:hypothetical protein